MSESKIKVELLQGSIPFRSEFDGFATHMYSPFQDFYDFWSEEVTVGNLIATGIREGSVEDIRLIEFHRRKEMLEDYVRQALKQNGLKVSRKFSLDDYEIKTLLGRNDIISTGKLVSEIDTVSLLTNHAASLIFGKRINKEGSEFFNTGMMTASRCLAEIFDMTTKDNPFVDQALVYVDSKIESLNKQLNKRISDLDKAMKNYAERGINLSLLKNEEPRIVPIIVHSPYSFKMIELLKNFDFYVLWILTFQRKGLKSKEEGFSMVREMQHDLRNLYVEIKKLNSILSNEHIGAATRNHWLEPTALPTLAEYVRNTALQISNEVLCNRKRPWNFVGKRNSMTEQQIIALTDANKKVLELSESLG